MTSNVAVSLGGLLRVTEAMEKSRGLDDLLTFLIARARDLPDVDTVRILILDETGTQLVAQAGVGFHDDEDAAHVPVGRGFSGQIARTREPRSVVDLDDFPVYSPTLRAAGVRSIVGVPLLAADRLVGVMHIGSRRPGVIGSDVVPTLQDIAARVAVTVEAIEVEQARAESEARFRELFNDAPVGIVMVDLAEERLGEIVMANPAMSRITGVPVDGLVGRNVSQLLVAEDRPGARGDLRDLAAGSRPQYTAERRLMRADGTSLWVRGTVAGVHRPARAPYAITFVEDITARKEAEDELARRAFSDPLTGLANRHLVNDHLRLALLQQERTGGAVGVLYIDLDRFKVINDGHGHDVGDQVLQEFARRLSSAVRAGDTAARLGGDEFVVVCPRVTGQEELAAIAGRLLLALDRATVPALGPPLDVGVSIGIACSASGVRAEELIRRADAAMYEAKRRGRHRWHAYDAGLEIGKLRRRAGEQVVQQALDNDWFRLHFQPIVDLMTGDVRGAEALVRINHPELGLLLPDSFLDVLEDSDLGEAAERWILQEACSWLRQWQGRGLPEVSVNISGRLAAGGRLTETVAAAASRTGVPMSALCLEMTERVLVNSGSAVLDDFGELVAAGATIAIDDFGTGYASLAYLQRFPISTLKIDRSFVTGVLERPRDAAIVTAIASLSAALDMHVVAEGVENPGQADRLREIGCGSGQGWHFGRPCPGEDFGRHLAASRS